MAVADRCLAILTVPGSVCSFISFLICYLSVYKLNESVIVDRCLADQTIWWLMNAIYLYVVVSVSTEGNVNCYVVLSLCLLATGLWLIPTVSFAILCEGPVLIIVSILQVFWLFALHVALFIHEARTVVPPTAEAFTPPIAVPAVRVTRGQPVSTAREAELAQCV